MENELNRKKPNIKTMVAFKGDFNSPYSWDEEYEP